MALLIKRAMWPSGCKTGMTESTIEKVLSETLQGRRVVSIRSRGVAHGRTCRSICFLPAARQSCCRRPGTPSWAFVARKARNRELPIFFRENVPDPVFARGSWRRAALACSLRQGQASRCTSPGRPLGATLKRLLKNSLMPARRIQSDPSQSMGCSGQSFSNRGGRLGVSLFLFARAGMNGWHRTGPLHPPTADAPRRVPSSRPRATNRLRFK